MEVLKLIKVCSTEQEINVLIEVVTSDTEAYSQPDRIRLAALIKQRLIDIYYGNPKRDRDI